MPVLTRGAVCFSKFYKIKFGNLVEICFWLNLAVKGLMEVQLEYGNGNGLPQRNLIPPKLPPAKIFDDLYGLYLIFFFRFAILKVGLF